MSYISITIKPTNGCNMRCKHCYHAEEGFNNEILPIEYIEKILKLTAKEYTLVHVLIHGGEPTLCGIRYIEKIFLIEKMLHDSYDTKFTNTIQTNGLKLDDEWIELFKRNKVNVGISFDGIHNDDLRQCTDSVKNNIIRCYDKGLKVGILCVETKESIDRLIDNYEWFKQNSISYKILPVFKCGYAKTDDKYLMSPEVYVEKLMKLYEYWLKDETCSIRVNTLEDFAKLFNSDYEMKFGGSCICHRISLNSNGKIYPCGRPYDTSFYMDSIEKISGISSLFNSEGYKKIIDIMEERQKNCLLSCEFYNICKGGCISNSIIDGSYSEINGNSCTQSRLIFENVKLINESFISNNMIKNPRATMIMERKK